MYYFLLNPYQGPTKANYQHSCIVLAEGFKALGVQIGANIDYYPDSSGVYLFNKHEPTDEDCTITSSPETFKTECTRATKLVVLDTKDEWARQPSLEFLSIAHRYFMSSCSGPNEKIRPFCFAASNRMLSVTDRQPLPWSERSNKIVWAHRVDNHYLRNVIKEYYIRKRIFIESYLDNFEAPPTEALHEWNHTGRRHSPAYFNFLRQHKYIDAHGGYPTRQRNRIVQWDSWKVWEGLLSGCLVITADLDYYNIILPYRLVPYVHYIPIRYDQIQESYDKLFALSEEDKERIALAGYFFARTHFSPTFMAKYFIENL